MNTLVHLRPFTAHDYQAYAQLLNISNPNHPRTPEDLKQYDEGHIDGEVLERHLWEHTGELLGAIEVSTPRYNPVPGHLSVEMHLRPTAIESSKQLYAATLQIACSYGPQVLVTSAWEGRWELDFYQSQGFREVDRMWASLLDVTTFNPTPFEHFTLRSKQAGVMIKSLSDLPWQDEHFQRRWYTLVIELLADIPSARPNEPWPFELWQKRVVQVQSLLPQSYFFALHQDELVGLSELRPSNRPQTIQTGLTGVHAHWRRRGIAQTLKLTAVRYAQSHGYQFIRTNNHSVNRPILSINEAMGFVKESIRVNLEKNMISSTTQLRRQSSLTSKPL